MAGNTGDETKKAVWRIRAGEDGQADGLFLTKELIALRTKDMGDLSHLAPCREAFVEKLKAVRPDEKEGYYRIKAGQVFRFVHEAKIGDLVVYWSKIDHLIYIGEITGNYQYAPSNDREFPQQRTVRWIRKSLSPTSFSEEALAALKIPSTFSLVVDAARNSERQSGHKRFGETAAERIYAEGQG